MTRPVQYPAKYDSGVVRCGGGTLAVRGELLTYVLILYRVVCHDGCQLLVRLCLQSGIVLC